MRFWFIFKTKSNYTHYKCGRGRVLGCLKEMSMPQCTSAVVFMVGDLTSNFHVVCLHSVPYVPCTKTEIAPSFFNQLVSTSSASLYLWQCNAALHWFAGITHCLFSVQPSSALHQPPPSQLAQNSKTSTQCLWLFPNQVLSGNYINADSTLMLSRHKSMKKVKCWKEKEKCYLSKVCYSMLLFCSVDVTQMSHFGISLSNQNKAVL